MGENPTLSRNCERDVIALSQDARRLIVHVLQHLRGTDDGLFSIFQSILAVGIKLELLVRSGVILNLISTLIVLKEDDLQKR